MYETYLYVKRGQLYYNIDFLESMKIFVFAGLGSLKLLQRCFDETSLCILGNLSYGAAFYWTAFVADDASYYSGKF